jgi:hypothetical protein
MSFVPGAGGELVPNNDEDVEPYLRRVLNDMAIEQTQIQETTANEE